MNISTNLNKSVFTYSLIMGVQKRFYRLDAPTSSKVLWNLRGTKMLTQSELELAPEYFYNALIVNLNSKNIPNVTECLNNMNVIFPTITKQKTLIDVKEPFSHEQIIKFYSDEQIQELLKKISLFANHLLKTDPKKALGVLECGLKMRSNLPTSEIVITLKYQYAKGLLLQRNTSVENIKNYLFSVAKDAENSDVLPSVMASIRSLQGFVSLMESMVISNDKLQNVYKNKSSVRKFAEIKHASQLFFQEATRLAPENQNHRINELAANLFLFGSSTKTGTMILSKSGTIKLIPTLENFLLNGRSELEEFYYMTPISAGVYHKLAELRDEIASSKFTADSPFLSAPLKALEKEKPLPTEKDEIVLDKPVETIPQEAKTFVDVFSKTRAKRNSKKITRE